MMIIFGQIFLSRALIGKANFIIFVVRMKLSF